MSNRISVEYTTTKDYSINHPPQFIPSLNIYNTLLLSSNLYNISDSVKIINETTGQIIEQIIGIDTDKIILADTEYYYYYIVNGIKRTYNTKYSILIGDTKTPLSTSLYSAHSPKLIMGSIILPDDYSSIFTRYSDGIINISNNNLKIKIYDIFNRYNHYVANTTTSTLQVLHNDNLDTLQKLNDIDLSQSYIRPLFNTYFPLGSISLVLKPENGVSNSEISYQLMLNNKSYLVNSNTIEIKNLVSGTYSIKIIDRNGPLQVYKVNNNILDSDIFTIDIHSQDNRISATGSLLLPLNKTKPNKGLSNIMINLDSSLPIEIYGNNFYSQSDIGILQLYNVIPGLYRVIQNSVIYTVKAHPNNTAYVGNL
jgi:hypothetical protein